MPYGDLLVEGDVRLRPWTDEDVPALVRLGDDHDIWLNLRDRFPHPFTTPAAQLWVADQAALGGPPWSFAVESKGELVGGVRLTRRVDAHHMCADLTFWLGRPHWGQGIALGAVKAGTAWAFGGLGLARVQAFVFDWNPAAAKVLEGAGYKLEGRLRNYVHKGDRLGDALLYARLRGEPVA
jgi:RimJ/RimL family protein N-acetyltransferase